MRVVAAALLAGLLAATQWPGQAVAREHHHTDPKAYLKRANELASEGRCAEAVKDYTRAYEKLQDPIVLFNRAECYRKLGENAKAAEDYRGFLKGFPAAPNRVDVEAKIAAMEKPAAPPKPIASRPPAPTPPAPPVAATPPAPPRTPPVAATPPAPAPPPPAPAPTPVETMPFLPPPPGQGGQPNSLVETPSVTAPAEKAKAESSSKSSHWWLWTGLAVLAVGGGVAGYIFFKPKDEPVPPSMLGNFRF
jgi:tetratricopeptide (TPR) repeat protein